MVSSIVHIFCCHFLTCFIDFDDLFSVASLTPDRAAALVVREVVILSRWVSVSIKIKSIDYRKLVMKLVHNADWMVELLHLKL